MNKPDYDRAATLATETLIKYNICSAPVSSLPILKKLPDVLVISFEKLSSDIGKNRDHVISMFGEYCQDAFTTVNIVDGKPQYIVTYNQMLSYHICQRALARELGHIILGHDGSRPADVRHEEAKCFAHHLLCPRPLLHSVMATGIRFTTEVLGNLTGCYDYCLSCMRNSPGAHVPPELNRAVRAQFMPYMINFFNFQRVATHKDVSAIADLGTYMDNYKE